MRAGFLRSAGFLLGAVSAAAHAQSSVTLFGTIDNGLSYISNEHGKGLVKANDGIFTPNLWGIRGTEDLGGGTTAIFRLVDQFALNTGSITNGQQLFSKTAYVGLSDTRLGTVTLGSQYDFMATSLWASDIDTADDGGFFFGFPAGPFKGLGIPNNPTGELDWDRSEGTPIANTVKYLSPTIDGISAGAMYGFGNVAGQIGTGNSSSFGLNYAGTSLGLGAAFTNVKYVVTGAPEVSIRNWGVGGVYRWNAVTLHGLVTTVRNVNTGGAAEEASVGARWQFGSAWTVSGEYMYLKGNAVLQSNHANQLGATLFYAFSKRTTVYMTSVYQRANDGADAQISGIVDPNGASSSSSQAVFRVGIHTFF